MKAHSERVPEKNARVFNGRPLFHWILATLEATPAVDEIVVNSDAERIKTEAAERFGARIINRPPELQGGTVTVTRLLKNDLTEIENDELLMTFCTAPLLTAETIAAAVNQFRTAVADGHDSLFSVTRVQERLWTEGGEPFNHDPDDLKRTQDLQPLYLENSNIYLFTREALERRDPGALHVGADPVVFEMEATEAVDIDEVYDFKFAETLHRERYGDEPALDATVR